MLAHEVGPIKKRPFSIIRFSWSMVETGPKLEGPSTAILDFYSPQYAHLGDFEGPSYCHGHGFWAMCKVAHYHYKTCIK